MYPTLSSGSPSFLQSSAVSCKRSSFLPVNANLAPQRESSTAHAHPMPLLAPGNTIHIWSTSRELCTQFTLCFIRVHYRSVMPIFFKVTSPLKRKGCQDDCHARHWERPQWRPEQSSWRHFRVCDWHRNNHMMTSPNGNIFRVTGPLWRESTGHRWISLTEASDVELRYFLWSAPEQMLSKQPRSRSFETPSHSLCRPPPPPPPPPKKN